MDGETWQMIRVQLRQSSEQQMTEISNQNNWALFERRKNLPMFLPSWAGLDDKGWAWRVLCLNHLNLLEASHQDYQKGLMSNEDHEAWVLRAKYWFRNLRDDTTNPDMMLP